MTGIVVTCNPIAKSNLSVFLNLPVILLLFPLLLELRESEKAHTTYHAKVDPDYVPVPGYQCLSERGVVTDRLTACVG